MIKRVLNRLLPNRLKQAIKSTLGLSRRDNHSEDTGHLVQFSQTVARVNFLHDFAVGQNVDLVDLGDVRLLMYVEDNLYQLCVPEHRKNISLKRHYEQQKLGTIPLHPLASSTANAVGDPRFAIELVLSHLFSCGVAFTLFDIGAWVGDFAIRMASFARSQGQVLRAICFDPSLSGNLIPHNIALNRLNKFVQYEPIAISDVQGPVIFSQAYAHSDSAAIDEQGRKAYRYLVSSTTAAAYVREKQIEGLLIFKIDTEGMEQSIVKDITENIGCDHIFILEFSPSQITRHGGEPLQFLEEMANSHFLFDLFYLGCPTRTVPLISEKLPDFVQECLQRKYGFTDVLAFPKSLVEASRLAEQLASLRTRPDRYTLVGEK